MQRFLLCCLLTLSGLSAAAQQDSIRKYLDAELHFVAKKDMKYPAIAIRKADHWLLYAVYPDTSVLLQVMYRDEGLTVKDGDFILFHPKRRPAQMGKFVNNVAEGRWQTFYADGKPKEDGTMVDNHLAGVWKEWYASGQLMSSRTYQQVYPPDPNARVHENAPGKLQKVFSDLTLEGVLEGPSSTWYENGNKESDVNYHHDSLAGACTWYRSNGKPSSKETYTDGKVTELACYDSAGEYTGATCSVLKLPVLIHPMFGAQDYIVDALHRDKNKDIREEGDAEISFTVTEKGAVQQLVIVSSPDPALSKHIMQIFATMPPWSPAVTHNRMVSYPMKLTIPFYRN